MASPPTFFRGSLNAAATRFNRAGGVAWVKKSVWVQGGLGVVADIFAASLKVKKTMGFLITIKAKALPVQRRADLTW